MDLCIQLSCCELRQNLHANLNGNLCLYRMQYQFSEKKSDLPRLFS